MTIYILMHGQIKLVPRSDKHLYANYAQFNTYEAAEAARGLQKLLKIRRAG